MEQTMQLNSVEPKKSLFDKWFSKPLFKQTFKSTWVLWLIMTIGSAAIFFIINIVVCSKNIFTTMEMEKVTVYVQDENLQWLQILGLLENMGFNLSRIQVMSRIDLNSVMNDLVYKIAGVLLPMIYVMITANSLIASQVNSGSMAYILSTPTSRKTVIRTNYAYMVLSLIAMYAVILGFALGSETIAGIIRIKANGGSANMIPLRTVLYCFASFCAMFALTGICFGASAFFNKSTQSIAVGGGACILSFICCIMGLFGNKVFVSVGVGVEAMNVFNYASLFTLIDTESMSAFAKASAGYDVATSFNWIWEIGILLAIGVIFALLGSIKFVKKDLPL